jgi:3-hydroxybutyryl-CoA dehydrogenase/5-formyl-3-hydroxy-2-methylpyridine 4-carboxylate dehydrogenase
MKRVALLGMGTMGPGIAARLARGGLDVAATDVSAEAVARVRDMLPICEATLDQLGIAAPHGGAGTVSLVDDAAAALAEADLVIENVPENAEVKGALYREIEPLIGPETIIASDTSGIPITKLQAPLDRPERLVGMHWSNPPHIIPMIEVVSGEKTAKAVRDAIVDLIRRLGLLPVVVKKDVPGFVENRVLYAVMREAIDLVDQGVIDPEDLDTCVGWGIGYKLSVVGPMALLDMAGLDVYRNVASFLNAELSDRKDVSPTILEKTEAGKLGLKTGEGLFAYPGDRVKTLQAERARQLVAVRRALEGSD